MTYKELVRQARDIMPYREYISVTVETTDCTYVGRAVIAVEYRIFACAQGDLPMVSVRGAVAADVLELLKAKIENRAEGEVVLDNVGEV